jgi:hypothetical protein
MLDYLVFELVEKTQPDLRIIATPETGLFTQEPAYRLRTADGRHRPVPINPDDTSGEVFVADPNGQLNPANISVTLEEWNQYFSHYRQVGDGSLSAENLREFLESPTPDTASTAQAD